MTLESSLESHRRYYTSVFTGWVVLFVTSNLNFICKIDVVPHPFLKISIYIEWTDNESGVNPHLTLCKTYFKSMTVKEFIKNSVVVIWKPHDYTWMEYKHPDEGKTAENI